MRLGNFLRKRSLGASQDLETKMCDWEGKSKKTLSAREGRVITCVLQGKGGKKTCGSAIVCMSACFCVLRNCESSFLLGKEKWNSRI